jgi:hypothetical protein
MHRSRRDTSLPAGLLVPGLGLPAWGANLGATMADSGRVVTEEISQMRQADSSAHGMKFVQLVVLPLLFCVLFVAFLRRFVFH